MTTRSCDGDGSLHDQHAAVGMVGDMMRDAATQQACGTSEAAAADHDQVGISALGLVDDDLGGVSLVEIAVVCDPEVVQVATRFGQGVAFGRHGVVGVAEFLGHLPQRLGHLVGRRIVHPAHEVDGSTRRKGELGGLGQRTTACGPIRRCRRRSG